jgi:plastocyanin
MSALTQPVRAAIAIAVSITAAALVLGAGQSSAPAAAPAVQVNIQDYAFQAPSITVAAGTEVDWTNKDDDPHTVTADDGSFDSKGLGQDDTFKHVFATPGRYPYHCAAHPFMKGVVIVTGGKS